MHTSNEDSDDQKEFISTVIPFKDLHLYRQRGYSSVGASFLDDVKVDSWTIRRVRKITVRKRIERSTS